MTKISKTKRKALRRNITGNQAREKTPSAQSLSLLKGDSVIGNRRFELFIMVALLVFGIYQSIIYFGHQEVPNSDFPGFVRVARSLLSFELPQSFKRAPVLGILQILISKFVSSPHPILYAGWLLNGILHPLNIILLYQLGKRLVGLRAYIFAIPVIINPWTIAMLTQPIVETTLVFFILLTFYFMVRRSNWCYFFASVATMVRYEGAALIVVAFIIDMIYAQTKRQRLWAGFYSALSFVPLMLWLAGTILMRKGGMGQIDYIRNYGHGTVFLQYIEMLWRVTFSPLFMVTNGTLLKGLGLISRILAAGTILGGVICGLYQRKRDFLSLLFFLALFVMLHGLRADTRSRYCMPIAWLALLLCWYGISCLANIVRHKIRPPGWIIIAGQIVLLVGMGIWVLQLGGYLGNIGKYSRASVSMPYVTIALAVVILLGRIVIYKGRYLRLDLVFTVFLCLIAVSNQFTLVPMASNGQTDVEFKWLADWYANNAGPEEKMVTTLPSVVRIFVPGRASYIVHTADLKSNGPREFIEKCYANNITYLAWDSRLGLTPNNSYYRRWGLKNIAMLVQPQNTAPFRFLRQIKLNDKRYINIFQLCQKQQQNDSY